MANAFQSAIHTEVYDLLSGGLSEGVYDHVPYQPPGDPDDRFPYVVIGENDHLPFDTDDTVGNEVRVNVHVFTRELGREDARRIMDEVFALMHRASFTKTGYNFIDSLLESSDIFTEEDGKTRHGVMVFLITVQEA